MITEILSSAAAMGGQGMNIFAQNQTNRDNKDLTREQMNFQNEMSSTAHQREVRDLQKAGLNPILSAGTSGSSTPSGAASTLVAPKIEMPDLMAYGVSLKQLDQAQQKINNETLSTKANVDVANSTIKSNDLKNISEKLDQQLKQRGMPAAKLGQEASTILTNIIDKVRSSVRNPQSPMADKAYDDWKRIKENKSKGNSGSW